MAIISAKVAAKIAVSLMPEDTKKIAIFSIVGFIGLPIILIMVIFTGGFYEDGKDNYTKAFESIGCDNEYLYTLDDIRFFDSYTYPSSDSQLSVEDLGNRMEEDYYNFKYISKVTEKENTLEKKVCLLKNDEEIYEILHTKYNVDEKLKDEILDSVQQIRNSRQDFVLPVADAQIENDYSDPNNLGIYFSSTEGNEVFPIADGTIKDIYTDRQLGLCVYLKHDVLRGLNENGEYNTSIMYSKYTNLKNVNLSVGDKVESSKPLGKLAKDTFYFELLNSENKEVNPHEYMYIGYDGDIRYPFDEPFTITNRFGPRELDGFHYGLDLVKSYGAEIKSMTEGEVIAINSTCAPNGGPSKCPLKAEVLWGGNYVVVKSKIEGVDYYIQYCHMKKINASKGQHVYPGQVIGYQGNSGNSYGSHLHLEIHTKGINSANKETAIDPEKWLDMVNNKEEIK